MLQWMVYVAIVSLILGLAALSAERSLRLRRKATRWVWAVAIVASLVVPTIIASVSVQMPNITASTAPTKTIVLRNVTSLPLAALSNVPLPPPTSTAGRNLDSQLKRYWWIASGAMVLLLAASAAQGRATALTLHQNGRSQTAPRIDDHVAQQIEDALKARVASQTPTPGTEAAVRRLIEGLRSGKPNYEEMSPRLAEATRQQLPHLSAGVKQYGAIQSIEFRGVGSQGWDVYDVRHENGRSTWRVLLSKDGKTIEGALVMSGP
jgi:hypothetical protein